MRHAALPALVFAVGVAVTMLVTQQYARLSDARDAERFQRLVDQRVEAIDDRLDTYIALLRGTAGLMASRGDVDGASFAAYVARLAAGDFYPGIQGIGFSRWFTAAELADIEAQMRAQRFPEFSVTPDTPRDVYSSILFLEPQDARNAAAIGYDMFSEPIRRAAMERSRDEGVPAMTGRVELVQEIDEDRQAGFLIYVPVYEGGGLPATVEERRARLSGWAYSPFRAGDLFSRAIEGMGPLRDVELLYRVYDAGEPGPNTLLYDSAGAIGASAMGDDARFLARRTLEIAGRDWSIELFPSPGFERESHRDLLPYLFGLGFLATLLLTGAAALQSRATREAEAARVDLQAETERLERLNEVGNALASELDVERLVRTVIEAATRLTGASYGAFFERISPEEDEDGEEAWRLFSLSGAPREAFTRFGLPRATALFSPTFAGQGVVRADDVSTDARYGSMGGMPQGHLPVRSYLAVPVISRSGERLGALLFGHPEPARFGEREEKLVAGFAGQAAVALENARLLASVQAGQERFRAAVEALRGFLWTTDATGRMGPDQQGWERLTGQSSAAYKGHGWADAVHPDDVDGTLAIWNAAVATNQTYVYEHRVRRADGSFGTFAVRAIPVADATGAVREWVGVHTDITEQREAEAELRESNEEIQRFAYIVSHDLRAPLVNVMGFTTELAEMKAELLEAGTKAREDPERQRAEQDFDEALSFIQAGITKMERLIAAVLKLSREGRRSFNPEPLEMRRLVQGLADAQRHQADAAEAQVVVSDDLPDLASDRLAIEQVFGNLIDNAIKYLQPGRPGRIVVSGEVRGKRVVYRVVDNGRGIGPRDRDRVFELFRRAGRQDQPGEGIGLAHVRALVRVLGGRIELSSVEGEGTTFKLTFPHARSAPPQNE